MEGMRNSKEIYFLDQETGSECMTRVLQDLLYSQQTLLINPRMLLQDVSSQDRVSDAPTV